MPEKSGRDYSSGPMSIRDFFAKHWDEAMELQYGHDGPLYDPEFAFQRRGELDAMLPEITSAELKGLGIEEFQGEKDAQRTASFKWGEGFPAAERFEIDADQNGKLWLIEFTRRWTEKIQGEPAPKIENLEILQHMQEEVFAYRIAKLIGYPMAETKLQQKSGQPVLVYDYQEGREDTINNPKADSLEVINKEDRLVSPLFASLIGYQGEPQSFITKEGVEMVYDVSAGYHPEYFELNEEQNLRQHLVDAFTITTEKEVNASSKGTSFSYKYGPVELTNPEVDRAAMSFMAKLNLITPEAAAEVFKDLIGREQDKQHYADMLLLRARVLPQVYVSLRKPRR